MKKLKELRAKIDEVSTGYLNRYVGLSVDKKGKLQKSGAAGSLEKAAKASTDAVRSGDKEAKRAATKTVNKRAKGLQMARAKLDKKAKVPATEAAKYPHMMYDPKTGKEVTAKTPADHNKYAKMGYTHEKPKVDEALTLQQRMKRSRLMKRMKSRIAIGRKRAMKKMANKKTIEKRALRQARNQIAKKLTRGVPKGELTFARKQEIEKRLEKPALQQRIKRIAKKLFKDVRKKELERKKG